MNKSYELPISHNKINQKKNLNKYRNRQELLFFRGQFYKKSNLQKKIFQIFHRKFSNIFIFLLKIGLKILVA